MNALGSSSRIYACDIVDQKQVDELCGDVISDLGYLDVLVNCSTPRIVPITFDKLTWQDMEEHLLQQIKGTLTCVSNLRLYLKNKGMGR